MNNLEALKLVEATFAEILKAEKVSGLREIVAANATLKRWQMDRGKYPELQLHLTAEDVRSLRAEKLDDDLRLHADLSARLETPLEKLLYAIVWKQGDLQKVGQILEGALEAAEPTALRHGQPQVFKQFGRHLANRAEPIVDQHVLRAFELYEQRNTTDPAKVKAIREKDNWNRDVACIERYKQWLREHFSARQSAEADYVVNADMVLFALGRAIKITSKRVQTQTY